MEEGAQTFRRPLPPIRSFPGSSRKRPPIPAGGMLDYLDAAAETSYAELTVQMRTIMVPGDTRK